MVSRITKIEFYSMSARASDGKKAFKLGFEISWFLMVAYVICRLLKLFEHQYHHVEDSEYDKTDINFVKSCHS